MQVVGTNGVPDADLVEAISYSSKNPYFRTADFRQVLILYRNEGCYAEHPKKPPTPKAIVTAINKRKSAMQGQFQKWSKNQCE